VARMALNVSSNGGTAIARRRILLGLRSLSPEALRTLPKEDTLGYPKPIHGSTTGFYVSKTKRARDAPRTAGQIAPGTRLVACKLMDRERSPYSAMAVSTQPKGAQPLEHRHGHLWQSNGQSMLIQGEKFSKPNEGAPRDQKILRLARRLGVSSGYESDDPVRAGLFASSNIVRAFAFAGVRVLSRSSSEKGYFGKSRVKSGDRSRSK
jgi:hypothetical protein